MERLQMVFVSCIGSRQHGDAGGGAAPQGLIYQEALQAGN
jgi:hypothetical protein